MGPCTRQIMSVQQDFFYLLNCAGQGQTEKKKKISVNIQIHVINVDSLTCIVHNVQQMK